MSPIYIALICVGCLGLTVVFVLFSNNCIKISRYKIQSEKAPESGVKIVHVSDLHAKRFGRGNARLFKRVSAQKPDFIAVTGDIIHNYRERDIKAALQAVEGLSKVAPVYYVSGNHEMRSTRYREFSKRLKEAVATVLDDECVHEFGLTRCGVN